jgi:hypothetical protein
MPGIDPVAPGAFVVVPGAVPVVKDLPLTESVTVGICPPLKIITWELLRFCAIDDGDVVVSAGPAA